MTQPSGRGGKSRIVIDVARVQSEERERRRGRFGRAGRFMSLAGIVVAALLVILVAGSYFWWQGFKRSPEYSLALLVDAAQRDDAQAVESLIDADQIAQGFVPQVIDNLAGANSPVPAHARGQLTAMLPQMLPRVRETMREEVAAAMKGVAGQTGGSTPFILLALGVRRATDVSETGDAATAKLAIGDRPVELGMRRSGELWKVVTVKDPGMAAAIAARVASAAPQAAPAQPQNQPRRKGR